MTATIQVRATPAEKALLKTRADAFGLSLGELCRKAIFNAKLKSKTDQQAIVELASTRADLGRVGGLLKGWLSGAFPAVTSAEAVNVRSLLRQIEAAQNVVAEAAKKLVKDRKSVV